MNEVYLLLGSNLNDREHMLDQALAEVRSKVGKVISVSSIYETEPWGFRSEMLFLNQVIRVSTALGPAELMQAIHGIERDLGRERDGQLYASRTIDIDILLYGERILEGPELTIPHPRMAERMFTLMPLCEINEGIIHPVKKLTMRELMDRCTDKSRVVLFHPSAS